MVQHGEIKVLNVAEKPSVARALAQVFRNCHGPGGGMAVRDRGSQRDVHELFTHENVHFPNVYTQGDGRTVNGPCTCVCECVCLSVAIATTCRRHCMMLHILSKFNEPNSFSLFPYPLSFPSHSDTTYYDNDIGSWPFGSTRFYTRVWLDEV